MKNFGLKFQNSRKIILAISAVAVVALCFFAWKIFLSKNSSSSIFTPSEFEQNLNIALKDNGKNDISLTSFKGKTLLLYSWASWCPFSKDDIPALVEMQKELGDKITIIAINRAEPVSIADDYLNGLGVGKSGLVFLSDPDDSFYKSIEGFSMPEAVIIDSEGNIKDHERGPVDLNQIKGKLQQILENKDI